MGVPWLFVFVGASCLSFDTMHGIPSERKLCILWTFARRILWTFARHVCVCVCGGTLVFPSPKKQSRNLPKKRRSHFILTCATYSGWSQLCQIEEREILVQGTTQDPPLSGDVMLSNMRSFWHWYSFSLLFFSFHLTPINFLHLEKR